MYVVIAALYCCSPSMAQSFRAGIASGLNIAYLETEGPQGSVHQALRAIPAGIFFNTAFNSYYGLQAELNYVRMGERLQGIQPLSDIAIAANGLPADATVYAMLKKDIRLCYLQLPVLLRTTIAVNKHLTYYALIGPSVSVLTSARAVVSGDSPLFADDKGTVLYEPDRPQSVHFSQNSSVRSGFKNYNLSGIGAAGIQVTGKRSGLFAEVRLTAGISSIDYQPRENFTDAVAFMLGYTINLN